MEAVKVIRSRTVVLPDVNVDTDQIIPARFLTTTSRKGLGQHLFADRRFDDGGQPRSDFILNSPEAAALASRAVLSPGDLGLARGAVDELDQVDARVEVQVGEQWAQIGDPLHPAAPEFSRRLRSPKM